MSVFVDTSALYAALDANDRNHEAAVEGFGSLEADRPVTHNYVLVESAALVQRRLGAEALRDLLDALVLPLRIEWVDAELHRAAQIATLAAPSETVSLVDRVSFELMRRGGIELALAFDRDFTAAGFRLPRSSGD